MKRHFKPAAAFVLMSLLVFFSFCSPRDDHKSILMKVKSIRGSAESGEMVLILQEEKGDRILPLSVGGDQALAIHLGQQHVTTPRPMTHDLIANIFKSFAIQVERITITELKDGTYYAEILLQNGAKTHRIDARPSDAIALSLRVGAPIYAMPNLLMKYSEAPETSGAIASQIEAGNWGLTVQTLTPALAEFFGEKEGVLISTVWEKGPAAKSGLQAGDIVLQIGRSRILGVSDFLSALAAQDSSRSLQLDYWRDGQKRSATMHK
jgi:hypothetical protein